MLPKTILVLLTLVGVNCYAQFGPQRVISTDADLAQSVFAIDIDGDDQIDVLSASVIDDKISWYRNTDGLGTFGSQNVIAILDENRAVYAADLDGDDDNDVIAVSAGLDLVVWYENLNGLGNFGPEQVVTNVADGAFYAIAADIDGDNDMDIISASLSDNKIAWYENTDGQGSFGPEQIVSIIANNGRSVFAADIDGDLDLDLVVSSSGSVILSWFENLDGQGVFGAPQTINPTGLATVTVFAIDLDGDTDLDVLSGAPANGRVSWYENLDGSGNFGAEQIITSDAMGVNSVFSADLDNDNDNDVLSASTIDNKISWYENLDGTGNFSTQKIISTEAEAARSVYAADIDNDTDIDVLSASQLDDKIAWYENLTILGVEDYTDSQLVVYPNPSKGEVNIDLRSEIITQIEIYNLLGEKLSATTINVEQIDIADLQAGIYLLKIYTENGSVTKKIIKK